MKDLRDKIMKALDLVLPCFYISNDDPTKAYKLSKTNHNFIVLAYDHSEPSATNGLASFRHWKVHIFVEGGSLIPIDEYVSRVEKVLKEKGFDNTRADVGDYFDSMLGKYRNSIEIITPRGEI